MLEKNIQFKIPNEDGTTTNCYILASIKKSENEINIIFHQEDDDDLEMRYGKLILINGDFELKKEINEEEINELKEKFDDEILNLAKSICENN